MRPRHAAPGPLQTVAIMLCPILPALVFTLPIPLAAPMAAHFADTPGGAELVPLVVPVSALTTAAFAPVAGRLIDSFGRIRMLTGALALFAITGAAPLVLDSLELILLSRVGLGVANGMILTTFVTLIGDGYRLRERDRLFGLQVTVSTVVGVLMPLLVVALAGPGWRAPFALHLVAVPIALLLVTVVPERHRLTRTGARRLPPLRWLRLGTACALTSLGSLLFYSPIVFLPGRLAEVGLDAPAQLGPVVALAGLGTVVGASSFGWLTRREPDRLLPIALLVGGLGVIGAGSGGSVPVVVVSAVVASAGCGLLLPTLLAWTVGSLNVEQRGRSTGWWIGCLTLGPVLLALVSAALAGPLGGVGGVLIVIGVVSLMLAAVAPVVVRGSATAGSEAPRTR